MYTQKFAQFRLKVLCITALLSGCVLSCRALQPDSTKAIGDANLSGQAASFSATGPSSQCYDRVLRSSVAMDYKCKKLLPTQTFKGEIKATVKSLSYSSYAAIQHPFVMADADLICNATCLCTAQTSPEMPMPPTGCADIANQTFSLAQPPPNCRTIFQRKIFSDWLTGASLKRSTAIASDGTSGWKAHFIYPDSNGYDVDRLVYFDKRVNLLTDPERKTAQDTFKTIFNGLAQGVCEVEARAFLSNGKPLVNDCNATCASYLASDPAFKNLAYNAVTTETGKCDTYGWDPKNPLPAGCAPSPQPSPSPSPSVRPTPTPTTSPNPSPTMSPSTTPAPPPSRTPLVKRHNRQVRQIASKRQTRV